MIQQKRQILIIGVLLAVVLLGVLVTMSLGEVPEQMKKENLLVNHTINEVQEILIENQNNSYMVKQEGEGFLIEDLPMDLVNPDYLLMLLQETSRIEYLEVVEDTPQDISIYGLDTPEAVVTVKYTNGESLKLLIGQQESVSQNRYIMVKGQYRVLLKKNNQTIRFTMPITAYFNLEIVPFSQTNSPLYAVGDITFSGKALAAPIEIEVVTADDEQTLRDAASFGATTHIIRSPKLHEVDQKEAIEIFSSVVGLLNERVLAYNCSDEELAAYGFDEPYLQIDFDFIQTKAAQPERIRLRVAPYENGYVVVRDEQRVVHLISDKAFLNVDYSRLVLRWFFSPLITDVAKVEVDMEGENYLFEIAGQTNKELTVTLNDKELDMQVFREYYTVLLSAEHDGEGLITEQHKREAEPVLTIKYTYKDQQKKPDVLKLYRAGARKLYAEANGVTEFKMQEQYLQEIKEATSNLGN